MILAMVQDFVLVWLYTTVFVSKQGNKCDHGHSMCLSTIRSWVPVCVCISLCTKGILYAVTYALCFTPLWGKMSKSRGFQFQWNISTASWYGGTRGKDPFSTGLLFSGEHVQHVHTRQKLHTSFKIFCIFSLVSKQSVTKYRVMPYCKMKSYRKGAGDKYPLHFVW